MPKTENRLMRTGTKIRLIAVGIACGGLLLATPAHAGEINVETYFDEPDTPNGDCSLREAIRSANSDTDIGDCTDSADPDTIVLAAGDHDLSITGAAENAALSGDLDVTEDLTITGAGPDATGVDGNDIDRVLDVIGGIVNLSGIRVHDGAKDSTGVTEGGTGIRGVAGSTLNIADSAVSGNTSFGASGICNGGGIRAATVNLTDSIVTGNSANCPGAVGGGIAATTANLANSTVSANATLTSGGASRGGGIDAGTATVTDSTVTGNSAGGLVGSTGGGINATAATLTNSAVSGNSAAEKGGGIFATTATLTGSTVSGNSTRSSGTREGGGIRAGTVSLTGSTVAANASPAGVGGGVSADAATLTDAVVAGNSATSGGGIHGLSAGPLEVSSSTVSGNDATAQGGGIFYTGAGTLDLTNSTVSGNEARTNGGAIHVGGAATANLASATINRNRADFDANASGDGGGISQADTAAVNLKNTILAGNHDAGGQAPDCVGTLNSLDYNLIGTAAGCTISGATTNNQSGDPLLALLASNGGPTLTHALLAGSPAIDNGNPAEPGSGGGACEVTDQRGLLRGGDAGPCDIGAFELGAQPPPVVPPPTPPTPPMPPAALAPTPTVTTPAPPPVAKKCKKGRKLKKGKCVKKKK